MNYAYISNYKIIQLCINLNIWNKERSIAIYEILKKISTYQPLFHYGQFRNLTENDYLYKLDNIENKKCIFCLKDSTQVSFEKYPHVIPYLLGNNFLLHHEECDECNEYFGRTIETELDKYLTPHRTLNKLTNRQGNLIHTDLGKKRGFRFDPEKNLYTGELRENEMNFDENSNHVTFNLKQPQYSPMLVYKAFMKIFYGLLPREYLPRFEELRKWIVNRDQNTILVSPLQAIKTRLEGFSSSVLDIVIFYKNTTSLDEFKENSIKEDFEFLAYLRFGSVVLEFPIFSDLCFEKLDYMKENNLPTEFNLPYIPKLHFPTNRECIDFSKTSKIKNTEPMYFLFDKVIKTEME